MTTILQKRIALRRLETSMKCVNGTVYALHIPVWHSIKTNRIMFDFYIVCSCIESVIPPMKRILGAWIVTNLLLKISKSISIFRIHININ